MSSAVPQHGQDPHKNLYRKLGATGRREAVARGRELGLL